MTPFLGNPITAAQKVRASWQHHPEAYVPVLAGLFLDNRQPRQGPKAPLVLQIQADLFQLGADSCSMLPSLPRLARFLAARSQFELFQLSGTNAASARLACLANISRVASSAETGAVECPACFEFAFELEDFDLARVLLGQWERREPAAEPALRCRIRLEAATGALGPALKLIDRILAASPNDAWALGQKAAVREKLRETLRGAEVPAL